MRQKHKLRRDVGPPALKRMPRRRRRRGRGGALRPKEDVPAPAPDRSVEAASASVLAFLQSLAGEPCDDEQRSQATLDYGDVTATLSREERNYFAKAPPAEREELVAQLKASAGDGRSVPLRFRVLRSKLPSDTKRRVLAKITRHVDGAGDAVKFSSWVETALAVPFGVRTTPWPADARLNERLDAARAALDEAVYGHRAAKQAILERIFLWHSNPSVPQRPLGLVGPPGNGKTTLVQRGLAAVMGRPFFAVPLGGSSDAATLVGHGFTYEGSMPGRVADALISGGVEDPVIFFDELDKISGTPKGEELANVLVHLTDTSQNSRFQDRYLHGLPLNLSAALFVFSLNDVSAVSKVLLDRLQLLQTDGFDAAQRRVVARDYLLPEILRERSLPPGRLVLEDAALELLSCPGDVAPAGVRRARAVLEGAVTKLELWRRTQEPALLFPLAPGDFAVQGDGFALLRSGAAKLVDECALPVGSPAPPPGMYC